MSPVRDALWESGYDEPVEVNQRALIDKVLARYSAEFTVFRELLQNSDDARSSAVEIHFESVKSTPDTHISNGAFPQDTLPLKSKFPDLKHTLVNRWVFKNNGQVFTPADWSRLKKIADGNPDEDKIGAFGVGFYSLFSETDEPRVRSGDQWMCFYWKDGQDQLFVRRGKDVESSPDSSEQWTTFEMPLRDPGPIPVPFDFARFLASSLTFMTHLSDVTVFLDNYCLIKFSRAADVPKSLPFPSGLNVVSPRSFMKAVGLHCKPVQIKAEIMRAVYTSGTEKPPPPSSMETITKQAGVSLFGFGRTLFKGWGASSPAPPSTKQIPAAIPEELDPTTLHETSISLAVYSVDVAVHLDKKLSTELQRATKKEAPTKTKYELIYTGKDEYDASKNEDNQLKLSTGSVFQALRADLDRAGSARIFIGHATAQTTGIGGNMSARFIPTVEREQLDLSNKYVGDWNKELLHVGGLLCRAAYEIEMGSIKKLWDATVEATLSGPNPQLRELLTNRCHHAIKFFTFYETTPQHEVRATLEQAFFHCSRSFPVMSTCGIRDASEVLMPDPAFSVFLKETPFLPDLLVPGPGENSMINTLRQAPGWLKQIGPENVIQELSKRPLNEEEMVACLKWWISLVKSSAPTEITTINRLRSQLLEAAILNTGPPGDKILPLSVVRRFLIKRGITAHIPTDGPIPEDLLPMNISQKFKPEELKTGLNWQELTVVIWLTYILDPKVMKEMPAFDITTSPPWAERVFSVLARAWSSLSRSEINLIVSLLSGHPCVPTTTGMKKPTEAYFATVSVFKDLPIVFFPSQTLVKGHLEQVLQAIGVRKHVDIQIVFDRMVKTNEWSASELTKYFTNVRTSLSSDEMDRLRVTPIFSPEPQIGSQDPPPRYTASQLHEPRDEFRKMRLPVLGWAPAKWRPNSEEAKFLYSIGLRRQPELKNLIDNICTSSDLEIRTTAFRYLLDHVETHYKDFDISNFAQVAFIPSIQNGQELLSKPSDVSTDPRWAAMGFRIVTPASQQDAMVKLKLSQHPSSTQLLKVLAQTPPRDVPEAKSWFGILAGHISDFSSAQLRELGSLSIVPVAGKDNTKHYQPSQCFFRSPQSLSFHSELFVFVDFGAKANTFLSTCGTQREPSVEQLAKKLLEDPVNFYKLTGGPQSYYRELTTIALRQGSLSSGTITRLKRAPVLLASRRKAQKASELDFEAEDSREYDLKLPTDIIIADDVSAYQLFGDSLWTAPPEETLEQFFVKLGSKHLSSLVKEEIKHGQEVTTGKTQKIRSLVLERLPLFLHDHSHSSRTKVSLSWLNIGENFKVKAFGTIQIAKTLQYGTNKETKKLSASAAASRGRLNGPVELWIANHDEPDMYEVATALNKYIFEAPKANDALLFMTILSTDLRSLSRRGYNVERILRRQVAQREAQLERDKEARNSTKLASESQTTSPPHPPDHENVKPPGIEKTPTTTTTTTQSPPVPSTARKPVVPVPSNNASSSRPNILQKISDKLTKHKDSHEPSRKHDGEDEAVLPSSGGSSNTRTGPPTRESIPNPRSPHVTPLTNISSNVDNAIQACRPESGHLLHNREQMTQVRESLNEGYCDISGRIGDLRHIGVISDVKIYTSEDVLEPEVFVATKHEQLQRLICLVLLPLVQVFNLPPKSLHVFHDTAGGLIAFNRNGSIFINFRYYEAWHDEEVRRGIIVPALISVYFTLAHELAHNLVQPHNAEHEFYFSAICEKHLLALGKLIGENE